MLIIAALCLIAVLWALYCAEKEAERRVISWRHSSFTTPEQPPKTTPS